MQNVKVKMMTEGALPTAVPSGGFPYYAWYAATADDSFQIEGMLSQQCRKLFDDIRRRRAPRTPVEQGPLSTAHSLSGPFWIGGGALMLGGCLSWMASDAAAGQPFQGRRGLVSELLHKLGGMLSYPWVASVTATIVGACLMWFIYRWINPVKGDIVRLR
jgi:hypothetical protein